MYGDTPLSLHEFIAHEEHPVSVVHEAIFAFLRGRKDCVIFGAQAVNAYARDARMTEDVDVLALDAGALAEALRELLAGKFHIAVRVRALPNPLAFRVYQLRKEGNRNLVDVRGVEALPPLREIGGLQIIAPEHLIAQKIIAYAARKGQLKSWTDRRDIGALLLEFPEYRNAPSPVTDIIRSQGAAEPLVSLCEEILREEIVLENDDDGY